MALDIVYTAPLGRDGATETLLRRTIAPIGLCSWCDRSRVLPFLALFWFFNPYGVWDSSEEPLCAECAAAMASARGR